MTRDREDTSAKKLEYQTLPKDFKPGDHYTTPLALTRSGLTKYSEDQIRYLFRTGQLPNSAQIGRQIILGESAVDFILKREQQRDEGGFGGTKPGTPSPRRGRQRLSGS